MSDDKIKNISEVKNKRYSLGYEDVNRNIEIEIFGLDFKMNIYNIEHFKENTNNKSLDEQIDFIIGENATKRLNDKMVKDGHGEMMANDKTRIIGFLIETYTKVLTDNMMRKAKDGIENAKKEMSNNGNQNYMNRSQRRYNERYNRRNNNRRYY